MTSQKSSPITLVLLIIGLMFAAANMRSPIVMIGSVTSKLTSDFGLTATTIGYLGALPMPLFALGALVAPLLARRFGLEIMMIAMTILLSMAVALRLWFGVGALFFGTLCLSFAIGMLNALTAPFIKQYAPNHIALATGIFSLSMSSLAGFGAWVVVPMTTVFGWQMAMSAWAFFGVVTIVIWGYLYCSYKPISHPPSASTPHHASTHFSPWRTPKAWQMAILLGVQSMLFYTLASFLPSIGTSLGLGISSATGLAFIFQMMSPLAIVVLTFLVRRGVGIRVFGIIGTLCNALGVAGLLWLPSTPILWSALMGLGCALVFTLSLMMFSLRTQNTDHARDLSGMVQAVGYAIALFGPLSMGKLFELTGSWHTPLLILLILMLINIPFGFLATDEGKIDAIDTRALPPH